MLLGLAGLCALVLPWALLFWLRSLSRKVRELHSANAALRRQLETLAGKDALTVSPGSESTREESEAQFDFSLSPSPPPETSLGPAAASAPKASAAPTAQELRKKLDLSALRKPKDTGANATNTAGESGGGPARPGLEFRFGARLFVWIGAAALGLAGVFLVKYSIDENLISPLARVILGGLFGAGLVASGVWVRNVSQLQNKTRMAQGLCGAGIASLYASLYAGSTVYHVIPSLAGFLSMAGVTLAAMVLAAAFGPAIALLGLLGGLATPALVRAGEPGALGLFSYLAALHAVVSMAARNRRWSALAAPGVLGVFGWAAYWLTQSFQPGDAMYLALFTIFVAGATVFATHREAGAQSLQLGSYSLPATAIGCATLIGSFVLLAAVAKQSDYSLQTWVYSFILAAGALALSWRWERRYWPAALAAMAAQAGMLLLWAEANWQSAMLIACAYYLVYAEFALAMLRRCVYPLLWAGVHAAGTASAFLLLLAHQYDAPWATHNEHLWLAVGAVLAGLALAGLYRGGEKARSSPAAGVLAGGGFAVLVLAVLFGLDAEYYALGFGVLALLSSLAQGRLDLGRRALFGEAALALTAVSAWSLINRAFAMIPGHAGEPPVHWLDPLHLHFSLHMSCLVVLLVAGWLASAHAATDNRKFTLPMAFESMALLAFVALAAFLANDLLLQPGGSFSQRGYAAARALSIACVWGMGTAAVMAGRRLALRGLFLAGAGCAAYGFFLFLAQDILSGGPAMEHIYVGATPIFNLLLVQYGLPVLWLTLAREEFHSRGWPKTAMACGGAALAVLFILASLMVRQFFHGPYLTGGWASTAEIYAYSVVWLLLGAAMLAAGVLQSSPALRAGSLAVVLAAVLKVFLYDAAELEGLLRVASFLGLGFSLIGLSVLYTQFVFGPAGGRERFKDMLISLFLKK